MFHEIRKHTVGGCTCHTVHIMHELADIEIAKMVAEHLSDGFTLSGSFPVTSDGDFNGAYLIFTKCPAKD